MGEHEGDAPASTVCIGGVVVRLLPKWTELEPPEGENVAPYLQLYGYDAADEATWVKAPSLNVGTRFSISVEGHEEVKGHTWYRLSCTLALQQESNGHSSRVRWLVPRRLSQIRDELHLPIKNFLPNGVYKKYFANTPFARTGGLSGTTGRLHAWFCSLASCINTGSATPLFVARTLCFLDTPRKNMNSTKTDLPIPSHSSSPCTINSEELRQSAQRMCAVAAVEKLRGPETPSTEKVTAEQWAALRNSPRFQEIVSDDFHQELSGKSSSPLAKNHSGEDVVAKASSDRSLPITQLFRGAYDGLLQAIPRRRSYHGFPG